MLAIEIDGESHNIKIQEDLLRQKRLESHGTTFLRFSDGEIKNNLSGVLMRIEEWIDEYKRRR